MFAQGIFIFMLAATVAVNAAANPINDVPSLWNHTIIEGRESVDNVLLHTETLSLEPIYFFTEGDDLISRFEVIDLDGIHEKAPIIYGGVGRYYLFVYHPHELDVRGERQERNNTIIGRFLVNIFKLVDNREIFRGDLNNRSTIIHTENFDNNFSYFGTNNITAFHIQALSNASAASLRVYGGVGHDYLFVVPSRNESLDSMTSTNGSHNFNITIYAELWREPNDFFHGEITFASENIYSRKVVGAELVDNLYRVYTNNWNVTQVRLYDNTLGYGGIVESVIVDPVERFVEIRFEQHNEIDFQLEIYAEL